MSESGTTPGSVVPSGTERFHAFLSHNGKDKPAVKTLADELEKRGVSCWLDEWNLIPGDPWQEALELALTQCDTCVVFFGPNGLGPWHNEEMRLALQRRAGAKERKLRVLPVILPGGQRAQESDLPGFLQGTMWVEFNRALDDGDALHRLMCGIRGIPPGRGPGAAVQIGECPYLGLRTFQPNDAPLFFGREAKVQELVNRLRENFGTPGEHRFLALIGASGSGKSSLALAGLIPAIARGEFPDSNAWPVVRMRPGTNPWESLQIALASHEQIARHLAAVPALITRPEDEQRRLHLTAGIALHERPASHRIFVLIDQFEETFTLCKDELARATFIDNILWATSAAGGRTIVVLTMRSDFYAQCAAYPGLRAAVSEHQSLIGPLSEQELREVIETPAQLAGGELEPGLMELLLADMKGRAGALPLLEHALEKLWKVRDSRRLVAKAYTDMGRLEGALDAHAEEFFTRVLTADEQPLCRQILVDLVRPGEGSADTKKRVPIGELAPTDAKRTVLTKLSDARLVTTDGEVQTTSGHAELAHEALIAGWRRLGAWVNEDRERSRLKERLLQAAADWQKGAKEDDFLYWGAQLAAAEEMFGGAPDPLPPFARDFVTASVEFRDSETREREAQRLREIEHERQLLEAQASRAKEAEELVAVKATLLDREARLKKRFQIAAIVAGILAAIGLGLADWATKKTADERRAKFVAETDRNYAKNAKLAAEIDRNNAKHAEADANTKRDEAERAKSESEARRLLAEARAAASLRPERVVLLLAEALKLNVTNHEELLREIQKELLRVLAEMPSIPLGAPFENVTCMTTSPNGRWIAVGRSDGKVALRDLLKAEKAAGTILLHGFVEPVNLVAISPNNRWLVAAIRGGVTTVWDLLNPNVAASERRLNSDNYRFASALIFSNDSDILITAYSNGDLHPKSDLRIWDQTDERWNETWKVLSTNFVKERPTYPGAAPRSAHGDVINSLSITPSNEWLIAGCGDGWVRRWNLRASGDNDRPAPIYRHDGSVKAVAVSSDGHWLATGGEDSTVCVTEMDKTGQPVVVIELTGHEFGISTLAFTSDDKKLLTGGKDGVARWWDVSEMMTNSKAMEPASASKNRGSIVPIKKSTAAPLLLARYTRALNLAGVSTEDPKIVNGAWDIALQPVIKETYEKRDSETRIDKEGLNWRQRVSEAARLGVEGLGLTPPTGLRVLSEFANIEFRTGGITTLAISLDGHTAAVADSSGTIGFLYPQILNQTFSFRGHDGWVAMIAFGTKDQWLLSAGWDGRVRLWPVPGVKLPKGTEELAILDRSLAAFRLILEHVQPPTGRESNILNSPELLEIARERCGRNFTLAEWQSYFPGRPYRKTFVDLPGHVDR